MNKVKVSVFAVLLISILNLAGCIVIESRKDESNSSGNSHVVTYRTMTKKEKNELAEAIAKKVVELQNRQTDPNAQNCGK